MQELHLQKVLSARLHNDQEDGVVIPIPEMDMVEERYNKFYRSRGSYKPPKQYIHVQRKFTMFLVSLSLSGLSSDL